MLEFAFCDVEELDVDVVAILTNIKFVRRNNGLQGCHLM